MRSHMNPLRTLHFVISLNSPLVSRGQFLAMIATSPSPLGSPGCQGHFPFVVFCSRSPLTQVQVPLSFIKPMCHSYLFPADGFCISSRIISHSSFCFHAYQITPGPLTFLPAVPPRRSCAVKLVPGAALRSSSCSRDKWVKKWKSRTIEFLVMTERKRWTQRFDHNGTTLS